MMEIAVPVSITVEDVVKHCLKTYNEEKRKPSLVENSTLYELRTYSEASFDNDDDDDDFPLDKKSEIAKCGVRNAALARAAGIESSQIVISTESRPSLFPELPPAGGKGSDSADVAYIRILMDSHSFTVQVPKDSTMERLLFVVAKKQKQNMAWEQFEFVCDEKMIERDIIVSDLKSTTLELRKKVKSGGIRYIPPSGSELGIVIFPDKETAAEYKEFEVFKFKSRLKQRRIMGIDVTRIYNKPPNDNFDFSIKELPSLGTVKRKYREMTDVVKAEPLPDKGPKTFHIVFRDLETNAIVPYVYEAMSERDCAEIVAKIEYLRK